MCGVGNVIHETLDL